MATPSSPTSGGLKPTTSSSIAPVPENAILPNSDISPFESAEIPHAIASAAASPNGQQHHQQQLQKHGLFSCFGCCAVKHEEALTRKLLLTFTLFALPTFACLPLCHHPLCNGNQPSLPTFLQLLLAIRSRCQHIRHSIPSCRTHSAPCQHSTHRTPLQGIQPCQHSMRSRASPPAGHIAPPCQHSAHRVMAYSHASTACAAEHPILQDTQPTMPAQHPPAGRTGHHASTARTPSPCRTHSPPCQHSMRSKASPPAGHTAHHVSTTHTAVSCRTGSHASTTCDLLQLCLCFQEQHLTSALCYASTSCTDDSAGNPGQPTILLYCCCT